MSVAPSQASSVSATARTAGSGATIVSRGSTSEAKAGVANSRTAAVIAAPVGVAGMR